MIIYLDTETTSIRPGQIAQLAYILDDGESLRSKNFWFAVEEMDPSSAAVNGLSVEKLESLSKGRRFCDSASEILFDLVSARAVAAHNANFDLNFLRTEFRRLKISLPEILTFDTMAHFTPICRLSRSNHAGYKFPKLSELTEFIGLTRENLSVAAAELFGAKSGFHDARFDAYAVYCAANRLKNYDIALYETLIGYAKN